ncbi:hypothetical protein [Micromonospora carbonacea]|uniref:Uncharacterized protein n=1 Tax=Micromonospora carbonacea TaxID=47853 RepID=A0A7H8XII1_9ACTN|nr:hypothetical protein [Micromonospora carbonacea]MBB5827870.1 hypothetical protein [Micromonospora carbonacea]QLD24430.1 hypothetical protein HXZ27_09610 [Micromonospora carbonacea]
MATLGSRARRLALALCAGPVLAGLLTGATATAAVAGPAAGATSAAKPARSMTVTDVWMRDTVSDVGIQPHLTNPLWASPDIKVCPTTVECATSTFPVAGSTSYIFVKLRNPGPYGSGTDSGTLRFYRTTPGGGLSWPLDWVPVTSRVLIVPPGVTTVRAEWPAVPGPGHFSLLAIWDSLTDPLPFMSTDIGTNVRYNNNIAWLDLVSV